jgi:hypothetical protein
MDTINTNVVVADAQLIYLLHDEMCAWGKGLSLKDAMANYKKVKGSRTPKKQNLSIYLCLQPLTEEEAFSEVRIDWCNQTYSSDKVVLLQKTNLK